ncbi:MAG TPA: FAD binding domain-containing protein [Desulfobacteria bacterium]|nr:FAD binding domain-containing protein [Desulfobacteria bacterium]
MNHSVLPQSLGEVWAQLEKMPRAMIYNGGTDVLAAQKGQSKFPGLICLERVAELKGVTQKGDRIGLGAGCTHARLLAEPLVNDKLPLLAQPCRFWARRPFATWAPWAAISAALLPRATRCPPYMPWMPGWTL